MNPYKKLIGDTAIYGMSSIVGRFLNYFLFPYYTRIFVPGEYGVVTNLMAYEAFLLIILTYGMETGYFRFASRSNNPKLVYSTSQLPLLITSSLFMLLIFTFAQPVAQLLNFPDNANYIRILGAVVAIDAFTSIPFCKLRLSNRPIKFAAIKLINIGLNITFNLFFLTLCPYLAQHFPDSFVQHIYSREIGVGYVFISFLISSVATLFLLYKEILSMSWKIDFCLLKEMLRYSFPILIIGLAGMVNQNIDKILIPILIPENESPVYQLGIYTAGFKLAVLMNLFIQAFRYAFEPFFFSRSSSESDEKSNNPQLYAAIMKYFVIFGLIIFLGMMFYIDIVKLLVDSEYYEGLKVVPLILMANLFFGIFFNLSIWYKIKDLTRYGAYIAIIGSVIIVSLNILLVPRIGYMGSAVAMLACFIVMVIINYLWGQKHYFVPYDLKRIGTYFAVGLVLYAISFFTVELSDFLRYTLNTLLFLSFFALIFVLEKKEISAIFKRNG